MPLISVCPHPFTNITKLTLTQCLTDTSGGGGEEEERDRIVIINEVWIVKQSRQRRDKEESVTPITMVMGEETTIPTHTHRQTLMSTINHREYFTQYSM